MNAEEGSTEGDETHSDEMVENPSKKGAIDNTQNNRNLFNPKDVKHWETSDVKEMESSMKQELRRLNHQSVKFQSKAQGFGLNSKDVASGYVSGHDNEEESMTEADQTGAENDDMNPPVPSTAKVSKKEQ
ncbi:hypothetical protein RFI_07313, partial [Reticulomyxa filosa]